MNFSKLKGETIVEVVYNDDTEITFNTESGLSFKLLHYQDCCEDVRIEDINGDVQDLVGGLVISAEEVVGESVTDDYYSDPCTWTFYKLDTNRGGITIRWVGTSNGYYSERVDVDIGEWK